MGLIGLIILGVGIWATISPKGALDFKIKVGKSMGAKIIPSKKTYTYYRYVGIGLIVLGLLILFY
jgi:hypothetical protein